MIMAGDHLVEEHYPSSKNETYTLFVTYPNKQPVLREVTINSIPELRKTLQVYNDQDLLINHQKFKDQFFLLESIHQAWNGASIRVSIPTRQVFIHCPQIDLQGKKVTWFPGCTTEQIETTIRHVCELPNNAVLQYYMEDTDTAIVLSPTIPNNTNVFVRYELSDIPIVNTMNTMSAPSYPQIKLSNVSPNMSPLHASDTSVRNTSTPSRTVLSNKKKNVLRKKGVTNVVPLEVLQGHETGITCMCIVGDVLFSGSLDSNILVWDLNDLELIGMLSLHKGSIKGIVSCLKRKKIFSFGVDRVIRVWCLETFECIKVLSGHKNDILCGTILEDYSCLVTGSEDRTIRLWCLDTLAPILILDEAHSAGIFCLQVLPNGNLVSGSRDKSIKVWTPQSWNTSKTLYPPHYDCVTCFSVIPNTPLFISASRDKCVKIWNYNTLQSTTHGVLIHNDWILCVAYCNVSNVLLTGCRDGSIKAWNQKMEQIGNFTGHHGAVTDLKIVNQILFSSSYDKKIIVWKLSFDTDTALLTAQQ